MTVVQIIQTEPNPEALAREYADRCGWTAGDGFRLVHPRDLVKAFLAFAKEVSAADDARFEFLEQQARQSPTGISFDFAPKMPGYADEPSGWRFTRRHYIGDAKKNIRAAIDVARRAPQHGE